MNSPTGQEVGAYVEAFSSHPWGEIIDVREAHEFLANLHERERSFFMEFAEAEGSPYLYIQGINYKDDLPALIEHEFTGDEAIYRASDEQVIQDAFKDCGNVTYIANIFADKKVAVSEEAKPRLKVFGQVVDRLFSENNSDTIALLTHRNTAVYTQVEELDPEKYSVQITSYDVDRKPEHLNENHAIDQLEVVLIRPK